jgi:hypothetical protein
MTMNRAEYRNARRICRDNGQYALRWFSAHDARILQASMFTKTADLLAERQDCYETMGWGIHLAKSIARHHAAVRYASKQIAEPVEP